MNLLTTENLVALVTLTGLEIVLGIDNIVFLALVVQKLPKEKQERARKIGLVLAMGMRILLLLSLNWVMGLTKPLFNLGSWDVSGRSLILVCGGLFLLGKSTFEMHDQMEGHKDHGFDTRPATSLKSALTQIVLLDIVFSLDSVITAVGMANNNWIMVFAVISSVAVMMLFVRKVSDFIEQHPTIKMLALAFLVLIGVMLISEGFGKHVEKGYIYFAMAFSLGVEMLNIRAKKK